MHVIYHSINFVIRETQYYKNTIVSVVELMIRLQISHTYLQFFLNNI